MSNPELETLAHRLVAAFTAAGAHLILAESLTGGMVADAIVSVPGASRVLLVDVVAYSDAAKSEILHVPADVLNDFGAVSEQSASAMAEGARGLLANTAKVYGAATTGVAGPDLQEGKPAGQVHIAVASADGTSASSFQFFGDRAEIRAQAAAAVLSALLEEIEA